MESLGNRKKLLAANIENQECHEVMEACTSNIREPNLANCAGVGAFSGFAGAAAPFAAASLASATPLAAVAAFAAPIIVQFAAVVGLMTWGSAVTDCKAKNAALQRAGELEGRAYRYEFQACKDAARPLLWREELGQLSPACRRR